MTASKDVFEHDIYPDDVGKYPEKITEKWRRQARERDRLEPITATEAIESVTQQPGPGPLCEILSVINNMGYAVSVATRRSGWGTDVHADAGRFTLRAFGLDSPELSAAIALKILYGEDFRVLHVPPPVVCGQLYWTKQDG